MKARTRQIQRLEKKKKIDYSDYQFALALYNIYKKESMKEARLPADDFRSPVFQKQSGVSRLKQKLRHYFLAFKKTITSKLSLNRHAELLLNRTHI